MELAWVIERADSQVSQPIYFTGYDQRGVVRLWSMNPDIAVRFARKVDAESISNALDTPTRIAEHGWMKDPLTTEGLSPYEHFFEAFRRINSERQAMWCEGKEVNPLFFATELGGEVGEALNEVKKLEREKLGWKGSRTTVEKLADELADVVICAQNLAHCYGIDLQDAITRKFNATSEKVGYPQRLPQQ